MRPASLISRGRHASRAEEPRPKKCLTPFSRWPPVWKPLQEKVSDTFGAGPWLLGRTACLDTASADVRAGGLDSRDGGVRWPRSEARIRVNRGLRLIVYLGEQTDAALPVGGGLPMRRMTRPSSRHLVRELDLVSVPSPGIWKNLVLHLERLST